MSHPLAWGWVLDASVGIKLCLEEPLSDRASALLEMELPGPSQHIYVPDLFFLECANVLWKHARRLRYPHEKARLDMQRLESLALVCVPAATLAAPALDMALAWDISAYDACYAALAHLRGLPLVTADQRLVARLAPAPVQALWLGDLPANLH